jgi:signal transduction histidine kinase
MPNLYPMDPADKADPSRNPMLALPRGSQIIGRVHIATKKRPLGKEDDSSNWLQPNMDRESLRSNDAFRLLWHISRFAVELLANFDRKVRIQEEEDLNESMQREARSELSCAIKEISTTKGIEPEYRQRLVKQLKIVEERFSESLKYEKDARLSIELMSLMGVMAGFMTHEFEKTMDILGQAASDLKKMEILDPKLKLIAEDILGHERSLANYLDYMRLFIDRARDPVPQVFKANAQVTHTAKTLSTISKSHGITTQIEIDPDLPGPLMPIAAYNGIVINLISNAIKAIVPKISDEPRKIRLYATNDQINHILVCADNGIGIPEYLRTRIWDPLFSTTAINTVDDDNPMSSGLGLGLSVVHRVIQKMGGKIELMNSAPLGFITAFKVTLPLGNQGE